MTEIEYEKLDMRASRAAWLALGADISRCAAGPDEYVYRVPTDADADLLRGIHATGSRGEAAVVWAIGERVRRSEERTRVTAEARLADAINHLASQLGAESAEALVARLPERIRPYAQTVLRNNR